MKKTTELKSKNIKTTKKPEIINSKKQITNLNKEGIIIIDKEKYNKSQSSNKSKNIKKQSLNQSNNSFKDKTQNIEKDPSLLVEISGKYENENRNFLEDRYLATNGSRGDSFTNHVTKTEKKQEGSITKKSELDNNEEKIIKTPQNKILNTNNKLKKDHLHITQSFNAEKNNRSYDSVSDFKNKLKIEKIDISKMEKNEEEENDIDNKNDIDTINNNYKDIDNDKDIVNGNGNDIGNDSPADENEEIFTDEKNADSTLNEEIDKTFVTSKFYKSEKNTKKGIENSAGRSKKDLECIMSSKGAQFHGENHKEKITDEVYTFENEIYIVGNPYNKINSFEKKMDSQLGKNYKNYGNVNSSLKMLNNRQYSKIMDEVKDFETYKNIKIVNEKYSYRNKLMPLIVNKKSSMDKLALNFFNKMKEEKTEDYVDLNKEWNDYFDNKVQGIELKPLSSYDGKAKLYKM